MYNVMYIESHQLLRINQVDKLWLFKLLRKQRCEELKTESVLTLNSTSLIKSIHQLLDIGILNQISYVSWHVCFYS